MQSANEVRGPLENKMRRTTCGIVLLVPLVALWSQPTPAGEPADAWVSLFNGKDLTGWDTWLGRPNGEKEAVGLNKDPKKVYTVVEEDGKPAIRISGEVFGALTTKK